MGLDDQVLSQLLQQDDISPELQYDDDITINDNGREIHHTGPYAVRCSWNSARDRCKAALATACMASRARPNTND
jgi:hypothetical protein